MPDERGAALAALIESDPEDADAYRAYGDWLEEQGDPRSQLMAMHILRDRLTAGLAVDRVKLDHLDARLTAFFEDHRDQFWGPLAKVMPKPTASRERRAQAPQLEWRYGFIYKAELRRIARLAMDKFLDLLLSHASGQFLVALDASWAEDPAALVRVLARRAPRSLRRLVIGVNDAPIAPLWPALSRLHELEISSATGYAAIELPALRSLSIGSCKDPQDLVRGLVRGKLPQLRTLALDFRQHVEEIVAALAGMSLAGQLQSLQLHDVDCVAGTPFARIASTIER